MEHLANDLSSSSEEQIQHRLRFTGITGEYFGLWLTNIALTIITIGFYAPWAKVRRERYLLGHTLLDGAAFEYTADPVRILKGRILIIAILFVGAITKSMSPIAFLVAFLLPVAALYPWALTMAVRFRCRYTSYRNLSFSFSGTSGDTFWQILGPKFLAFISLGLLFPWARHKERKYVIEHAGYGVSRFGFQATVKSFYIVYCIALPCVIVVAVISAVFLMLPAFFVVDGENSKFLKAAGPLLVSIFGSLVFAAVYHLVKAWILRLTVNGMTLGSYRLETSLDPIRYMWIAASNFALRAISLGLLTPFCVIRMRRYMVENLTIHGPDSIDHFVAEKQQEITSLGDQSAELYDLDVDFGF
jgi:uncharacterized membrane protein YjgN (DUF898 family)